MLLPVFLTRGRGAIVPRELGVLHAELLMEDLFLEESPGWCQHRPWLQSTRVTITMALFVRSPPVAQ